MTRNPYMVRTPIVTDDSFVGRKLDLSRLFDVVSGLQPQSSCLYGERRIGKTSLLRAFERRFRSELEKSDNYVVVPCDVLQADTPGELVLQLLERIGVSQPPGSPPTTSPAALIEQVKALAERNRRLVLLVDDFDVIVTNTRYDLEFFNFLRSLVSSYPVSMVLTSRSRLIDVCHSGEIRGSPFFNVFQERRLDVFTVDEVDDLIGHGAAAGVDIAPLKNWIVSVAGAFPLFLQIACSVAFEVLRAGTNPPTEHLTDTFMEEAEPHFEAIWNKFSHEERNVAISAADGTITQGLFREAKRRLQQAGYLLRVKPAAFQLFSDTFETFVRVKAMSREAGTPDAEAPQVGAGGGGIKVFLSYAHEDAEFLGERSLGGYLSGLERQGVVFWDDRQIPPGQDWRGVILNELDAADIVLLLVSQYWLNSEFVRDEEIRVVLQRRAEGKLAVVPVLVAPCAWETEDWLSSLQLLPPGARALADFDNRGHLEAAFLTVYRAIRTAADQIRQGEGKPAR